MVQLKNKLVEDKQTLITQLEDLQEELDYTEHEIDVLVTDLKNYVKNEARANRLIRNVNSLMRRLELQQSRHKHMEGEITETEIKIKYLEELIQQASK